MKQAPSVPPLACILLLLSLMPCRSNAQTGIIEAVKEATKKVIRAVDLQIQRLQNRTIDLQNVQKQIENTLSKLKLDEIAEWTERQRTLYQDYFDELWRVKSFIMYYRRIRDIIDKEKQLIGEYKRAISLIQHDDHFTSSEMDYIHSVYSDIIAKSGASLDQILLLLQTFSVQMSDADRLELLNRSADEINTYITDLRRFTDHNASLSLQRSRNLQDINSIKKLYGIE